MLLLYPYTEQAVLYLVEWDIKTGFWAVILAIHKTSFITPCWVRYQDRVPYTKQAKIAPCWMRYLDIVRCFHYIYTLNKLYYTLLSKISRHVSERLCYPHIKQTILPPEWVTWTRDWVVALLALLRLTQHVAVLTARFGYRVGTVPGPGPHTLATRLGAWGPGRPVSVPAVYGGDYKNKHRACVRILLYCKPYKGKRWDGRAIWHAVTQINGRTDRKTRED